MNKDLGLDLNDVSHELDQDTYDDAVDAFFGNDDTVDKGEKMEENKFTPGPWQVIDYAGRADYNKAVANSEGVVLAEIVDFCNDKENANLIAAAPEMYELLKGVCRECLLRDHETDCEACKFNRVLEKVRGEE